MAVYIDDVPAYAEAAQKLGMQGIVFKSEAQLISELRALELITGFRGEESADKRR